MIDIVKSPNKHYSPFRYPGGKSCLSTFLSEIIKKNNITNCTYVEPYAGGAGAALTMLFLEKVDNVIINDFDRAIYSCWKSILQNTKDFVEKINSIDVTIDEWYNQKDIYRNPNSSQFDLGFAAFFLNRTNRSGIIEGGPIGGNDQSGKWLINARFNKAGLIQRVENIASYKSRIRIKNKDGIKLITDLKNEKNQFVYLDPPYYVKGSCLYLNHYQQENHQNLANFLNKNNEFYWALTYDNVEPIRNLYRNRQNYEFTLNYHIDLPKSGKELLVVSDRVVI